MRSLFWMDVKVMFQVAGEILGSDILGQIGNAKSWIRGCIFWKVVRKDNRHIGVIRQVYIRWQFDLSVSVDCSDRLAHRAQL
jgi:hypothetical protein